MNSFLVLHQIILNSECLDHSVLLEDFNVTKTSFRKEAFVACSLVMKQERNAGLFLNFDKKEKLLS